MSAFAPCSYACTLYQRADGKNRPGSKKILAGSPDFHGLEAIILYGGLRPKPNGYNDED
jgi:hypothetical protein